METNNDTAIGSGNGGGDNVDERILGLLSMVSENTVILKEELERHVGNSDEKISRLMVLIDESFRVTKILNETSNIQTSKLIIHDDKILSLCRQITFLGIIVAVETAYVLYKLL